MQRNSSKVRLEDEHVNKTLLWININIQPELVWELSMQQNKRCWQKRECEERVIRALGLAEAFNIPSMLCCVVCILPRVGPPNELFWHAGAAQTGGPRSARGSARRGRAAPRIRDSHAVRGGPGRGQEDVEPETNRAGRRGLRSSGAPELVFLS